MEFTNTKHKHSGVKAFSNVHWRSQSVSCPHADVHKKQSGLNTAFSNFSMARLRGTIQLSSAMFSQDYDIILIELKRTPQDRTHTLVCFLQF